jgi:hypothetical protein
MSAHLHTTHATPLAATPPEVSLLLRAHAEQSWLGREVVPVVEQPETRAGLPEEQVGAALAYLEVAWIEAARRAGDTDAACTLLGLCLAAVIDRQLAARARRFRAAVVVLRDEALRRVGALLGAGELAGLAYTADPTADGAGAADVSSSSSSL